jgi:dinuclear metal center YbgI/SA1388 family protein
LYIQEIIQYLESIAPPEWQESYDNAGLIVGDKHQTCSGILVCLDSTEEVVEEAIQNHCNLIVAHHPILFSGLKKINGYHYVEKAIIKAIKHDIAIYAIHTNLDNAYYHGVNDRIARQLSLSQTRILQAKPFTGPSGETLGAGLVGRLSEPMPVAAFFDHVKNAMNLSAFRHTRVVKDHVSVVALCGGAGSFLIQKAIAASADVYITADIKYHEFFEANGQIIVLDIGHYESEKYTIDLLYTILQNKFSTFAVRFTKHSTNPVYYH